MLPKPTISFYRPLQRADLGWIKWDESFIPVLPKAPTGTQSKGPIGAELYIPQHPNGRAKEIALSTATDPFKCDVYSMEPSCSGGDYMDVGYMCDTEGGSSGSPVMLRATHKLVALHHCADCPNRAVPIKLVLDDIRKAGFLITDVECKSDKNCDDWDTCTENKCINGKCTFPRAPCETGDPCNPGYCDRGKCLPQPMNCGDNDPCTVDFCRDGVCYYVSKCRDTSRCTLDVCDAKGECSYIPHSGPGGPCDDKNECTIDRCSSDGLSCLNSLIPDCCLSDEQCAARATSTATASTTSDKCIVHLCNRTSKQCYQKFKCDDGSFCTQDSCNAQGVCTNERIQDCCQSSLDCALNLCTLGTCGSSNRCTYRAKCADTHFCTLDSCDPDTGACTYTNKCDDGNKCTLDTCREELGGSCMHDPLACSDADSCTDDGCDRTNGQCVRTLADSCNPCLSGTYPNGACNGHGICTALSKSLFKCECYEGYLGDRCQDDVTDACLSAPCLHGGNCSSLGTGRYNCRCAPGWAGPTCAENIVNPCQSVVCQRGGTCAPLTTPGLGYHGFSCQCVPPWSGRLCEEETQDQCASRPCMNGGTCRDGLGDFFCICPREWTGRTCSTDVDLCQAASAGPEGPACFNGGTCVEDRSFTAKGWRCMCDSHWTGTRCELDASADCDHLACGNGGSCVDVGSRAECHCAAGWTGAVCQFRINAQCASKPCQNGGRCLEKGQDGFACLCSAGYTGTVCETDLLLGHACRAGPCQNGGVCTDVANTRDFSCSCAEGYVGRVCDLNQRLSTCGSGTCKYGGVCKAATGGGFFCDCPNGLTGPTCSEDTVNHCATKPCSEHTVSCQDGFLDRTCQCEEGWGGADCTIPLSQNPCEPVWQQPCQHGSCSATRNAKSGLYDRVCQCEPGWTGRDCELDMKDGCTIADPTTGNPCLHGGVCVDGTNDDYLCICPTGWEGGNCERDTVNDCAVSPSPCLNGGTCVDAQEGYVCVCPEGWSGPKCRTDTVDQCVQAMKELGGLNPCLYGGTCQDLQNGFECICPAARLGKQCEYDNQDDCLSNPCMNGGTCQDGEDTYTCKCKTGWVGYRCELEDINACATGLCGSHAIDCQDGQGPGVATCVCSPGWYGRYCTMSYTNCTMLPVSAVLNAAVPAEPFCLNGGTCRDHKGADSLADLSDVSCVCPTDFGGPNCGLVLKSVCNPNPCQHQGICRPNGIDYVCSCAPGWAGLNCQKDIRDDCLSAPLQPPCLNNGTCSDQENGYKCKCPFGYSGSKCEVELFDQCSLQSSALPPCRNGGTCVDGQYGYICQCLPSWTGLSCEEDAIDECASSPCRHGGTCVRHSGQSGLSTFNCICPPDRTGPTCLVDNVDHCALRRLRSGGRAPCANGGTCIDLDGGMSCNCPVGWAGPYCEEDIEDACAARPCLHLDQGAICRDRKDGPGMFTCLCPWPYTGYRCELRRDSVCREQAPCVNGGLCLDEQTARGFYCSCPPGWTGENCSMVDYTIPQNSPCTSGRSPCLHNGVCVPAGPGGGPSAISGGGLYVCVCPLSLAGGAAWAGFHCEVVASDPCAARPCLNGGECQSVLSTLSDSFICSCPPGYSGPTCTVETSCSSDCNDGDVCSKDQCVGGVCIYTQIEGCCDPSTHSSAKVRCEDWDPCTDDVCNDNGVCSHLSRVNCRSCRNPGTVLKYNATWFPASALKSPPTPMYPSLIPKKADQPGRTSADDAYLLVTESVTDSLCDDGDECTVDMCDGVTGMCFYLPIPGCCRRLVDCQLRHLGDSCVRSVCTKNHLCATERVVDKPECQDGADDTVCTCDDGDACTDDMCLENGLCMFTPKDCDDGDPCTVDKCVGQIGCLHQPKTTPNCVKDNTTTITEAYTDAKGGAWNWRAPFAYKEWNESTTTAVGIIGGVVGLLVVVCTSALFLYFCCKAGGPSAGGDQETGRRGSMYAGFWTDRQQYSSKDLNHPAPAGPNAVRLSVANRVPRPPNYPPPPQDESDPFGPQRPLQRTGGAGPPPPYHPHFPAYGNHNPAEVRFSERVPGQERASLSDNPYGTAPSVTQPGQEPADMDASEEEMDEEYSDEDVYSLGPYRYRLFSQIRKDSEKYATAQLKALIKGFRMSASKAQVQDT
eukprot:g74689.t1